jgi:peptidoglycan/LPS O-acetylase OafA/YrhL
LGDVSYALYLIHAVVLLGLTRIDVSGENLVVLTTVISLALAYLIHQLVEKPLIKAGRRLSERKAKSSEVLAGWLSPGAQKQTHETASSPGNPAEITLFLRRGRCNGTT